MRDLLTNAQSDPAAPYADAGTKKKTRILLGQLNSLGDCLYVTALAHQIKVDYPGCHLTWAIGSMYRSILDENPYVDEVWEIPLTRVEDIIGIWPRFKREAMQKKKSGLFDEVFLPQLYGNMENYDGTLRSSLLRAYPGRITVPLAPVLRLRPDEVEKVRRFAESHALGQYKQVILFECAPRSAQSFVNPDFALKTATSLIQEFPDAAVILSSNKPVNAADDRIIDGSVLSFRENAELTKYCTLLVGCSSGISWLCTSDWAKPLPKIQLLKTDAFYPASFVHDHEYWGLPTDLIIEMTECPPEKLARCISIVFNEGFKKARLTFHERIPFVYEAYQVHLFYLLLRCRLRKAAHLMYINIKKHGFRPQLFWVSLPKVLKHSYSSLLKTTNDKTKFVDVLLKSLFR